MGGGCGGKRLRRIKALAKQGERLKATFVFERGPSVADSPLNRLLKWLVARQLLHVMEIWI